MSQKASVSITEWGSVTPGQVALKPSKVTAPTIQAASASHVFAQRRPAAARRRLAAACLAAACSRRTGVDCPGDGGNLCEGRMQGRGIKQQFPGGTGMEWAGWLRPLPADRTWSACHRSTVAPVGPHVRHEI